MRKGRQTVCFQRTARTRKGRMAVAAVLFFFLIVCNAVPLPAQCGALEEFSAAASCVSVAEGLRLAEKTLRGLDSSCPMPQIVQHAFDRPDDDAASVYLIRALGNMTVQAGADTAKSLMLSLCEETKSSPMSTASAQAVFTMDQLCRFLYHDPLAASPEGNDLLSSQLPSGSPAQLALMSLCDQHLENYGEAQRSLADLETSYPLHSLALDIDLRQESLTETLESKNSLAQTYEELAEMMRAHSGFWTAMGKLSGRSGEDSSSVPPAFLALSQQTDELNALFEQARQLTSQFQSASKILPRQDWKPFSDAALDALLEFREKASWGHPRHTDHLKLFQEYQDILQRPSRSANMHWTQYAPAVVEWMRAATKVQLVADADKPNSKPRPLPNAKISGASYKAFRDRGLEIFVADAPDFDPKDASAVLEQALLFCRNLNCPEDFGKYVEEWLKTAPESNEIHREAARIFLENLKDTDNALKMCDRIDAKFSGAPAGDWALYFRGCVYREQGSISKAVSTFKTLQEKNVSDPELAGKNVLALCSVYVDMNATENALALLNEHLQGAPTASSGPAALFLRGYLLVLREQYAAAQADFQQVIDKYPNSAQAAESSKFMERLKTLADARKRREH